MGIHLFLVSQIDLYLINFREYLFWTDFDVITEGFNVFFVILFVDHQILFKVGNVDVKFSDLDFQMDPDGNNGK